MKRLVAILLLVLVSASATHAQEPTPSRYPENTITVSGFGTAYGEPNVAYLELGVEFVNADLAAAFTQAAEAMNSVTEAIIAQGIVQEDIQTTGVSVFPEERFDPQGVSEPGERVYRVRNTVRLTLRDVNQIESVISAAVNAGANTIYNLNFGIADTQSLEQDARVLAVQNAQTRAQQLADVLGVTLGQPIVINESLGDGLFSRDAFGLGGAAFSQPVNPGQLSVTVQVQITFTIAGE